MSACICCNGYSWGYKSLVYCPCSCSCPPHFVWVQQTQMCCGLVAKQAFVEDQKFINPKCPYRYLCSCMQAHNVTAFNFALQVHQSITHYHKLKGLHIQNLFWPSKRWVDRTGSKSPAMMTNDNSFDQFNKCMHFFY